MKDKRGLGNTYLRGEIWWIHYSSHGQVFRESSKSRNQADALKLLKQKIGDAANGKKLGSERERITLGDMLAALRSEYVTNRYSLKTLDRSEPHLLAYFSPTIKAIHLDRERLQKYIAHRRAQPVTKSKNATPSDSTISQELRFVRRAFYIQVEAKRLSRDDVPSLKDMLPESDSRTGFLYPHEFYAMHAQLPERLRDPIEFLYLSGWRTSEMETLEWRDVNLKERKIVLRAERSKTKTTRTVILPEASQLLAIIERAAARRDLSIVFVFHHNRQPIGNFRVAMRRACTLAEVRQIIPHDFRRSAVRNFIRSGLSKKTAMSLSGHKSDRVFDRYDVTDEADLQSGAAQLDAWLRSQREQVSNVVPIRKTA